VIGDRSAGAVMEARMYQFVQGDPVAIFYRHGHRRGHRV
jgi:hypothetical protein